MGVLHYPIDIKFVGVDKGDFSHVDLPLKVRCVSEQKKFCHLVKINVVLHMISLMA